MVMKKGALKIDNLRFAHIHSMGAAFYQTLAANGRLRFDLRLRGRITGQPWVTRPQLKPVVRFTREN